MDYKRIRYWKHLAKYHCYDFIINHMRKVHTPMQQVMLQLEIKKELPSPIDALEMFGMHGLWHTMDYVGRVDTLEFCELNPVWLKFAKRKLSKYNVTFYCGDSIAYISTTKKRYSLVISDNPTGGSFQTDDGLQFFLKEIIDCTKREGIVILTLENRYLCDFGSIKMKINNIREAYDIFMVARNKDLSYVVVVFKELKEKVLNV